MFRDRLRKLLKDWGSHPAAPIDSENERSNEKTHFTSRHNYDTVMTQEEVN